MVDEFKDFYIDNQLGIKTTGRNDKHSDTHLYPYEPTSYSVLNRIIEANLIDTSDVILDYGCGKGRVPIYLYRRLRCKGLGVEFVTEFYKQAVANVRNGRVAKEVSIYQGRAEAFEVPEEVNVCFFFNPFDLGIMRGVMKKILESAYKNQRTIKLFFYYPQQEYLDFFDTVPELTKLMELDCMDLFEKKDERNVVAVYELNTFL